MGKALCRPLPRQTGHADFPHPAFLETVIISMHSNLQVNQAQAMKMSRSRHTFRRAPGSLTTALHVPTQTQAHISVQLAKRTPGIFAMCGEWLPCPKGSPTTSPGGDARAQRVFHSLRSPYELTCLVYGPYLFGLHPIPFSFPPVFWRVQHVCTLYLAGALLDDARAKFQDHPGIGVLLGNRVRCVEPVSVCWLEPEAWVVLWVAKNKDDFTSCFGQNGQAPAHELDACSVTLTAGDNGKRREDVSHRRFFRPGDAHMREEHVTNRFGFRPGKQRNEGRCCRIVKQRDGEIGYRSARSRTEGSLMHLPDPLVIGFRCVSYVHLCQRHASAAPFCSRPSTGPEPASAAAVCWAGISRSVRMRLDIRAKHGIDSGLIPFALCPEPGDDDWVQSN